MTVTNAATKLMRRIVQMTLRDLLVIGLPLALLIGLAFWGTYQFVQPAPPGTMTILTAAADGGYQSFALRYRDTIEANGVKLVIRNTAGSVENLSIMLDPSQQVDVAFVQNGVATGRDTPGIVSLGMMYPEPVWVFYRGKEDWDTLDRLRGKRIAVGAEGSGTRLIAKELLDAHGIGQAPTTLTSDSGLAAAQALIGGSLDAVFLVGGAQAGAVWTLLYSPGIRILNFAQAEAYARRFSYLSVLTLPQGAIDLQRSIPARKLTLVAPTAMLVAREATHPALVDLLLQAASEVHSAPGLFQKSGEYPQAVGGDVAVSKEAERYYRSGKPFLQRYLPFWAATLIDRLVIMLVPVFAILIPLIRIAPFLFSWRVRTRVFRYYGELKLLELQAQEHPEARQPAEWLAELDRIEAAANRIATPTAFADQVYTLRAHVNLVRRAFERRFAAPPA